MTNPEIVMKGDEKPNIILVNVPNRDYDKYPKETGERELTPYGQLSIATFVRARSEEKIATIDAENLGLSYSSVKEVIIPSYEESLRNGKTFRVGLNVLTPNFINTMFWGKQIEKDFPEAEQIYGGPHAYLDPESIAEHRPGAVVVVGEGEEPITKLVSGEKKENIQGILKRGEKTIPAVIHDLNTLPWIDRSFAANEPYLKHNKLTMSFMGSRGCLGSCAFCITPAQYEVMKPTGMKRIRFRNIDDLIEEVSVRKTEYKLELAQFIDDDLLPNAARAMEFLKEWKNRGLNQNMEFICLLRPEQIVKMYDLGILQQLADAGLRRMSLGIETGHDYGRQIMSNGKSNDLKYNPEIQKRAVKICAELGIKTKAFFMIGLTGETKQQIQQTFDFGWELKDLGLNKVAVFPVKIYPGTGLWIGAINNGFTKEQLGHYRAPNVSALIKEGSLVEDASRDGFVQEVKLSEVEPQELVNLANSYMKKFNT